MSEKCTHCTTTSRTNVTAGGLPVFFIIHIILYNMCVVLQVMY